MGRPPLQSETSWPTPDFFLHHVHPRATDTSAESIRLPSARAPASPSNLRLGPNPRQSKLSLRSSWQKSPVFTHGVLGP